MAHWIMLVSTVYNNDIEFIKKLLSLLVGLINELF